MPMQTPTRLPAPLPLGFRMGWEHTCSEMVSGSLRQAAPFAEGRHSSRSPGDRRGTIKILKIQGNHRACCTFFKSTSQPSRLQSARKQRLPCDRHVLQGCGAGVALAGLVNDTLAFRIYSLSATPVQNLLRVKVRAKVL